jgi:hypothetical protein
MRYNKVHEIGSKQGRDFLVSQQQCASEGTASEGCILSFVFQLSISP